MCEQSRRGRDTLLHHHRRRDAEGRYCDGPRSGLYGSAQDTYGRGYSVCGSRCEGPVGGYSVCGRKSEGPVGGYSVCGSRCEGPVGQWKPL